MEFSLPNVKQTAHAGDQDAQAAKPVLRRRPACDVRTGIFAGPSMRSIDIFPSADLAARFAITANAAKDWQNDVPHDSVQGAPPWRTLPSVQVESQLDPKSPKQHFDIPYRVRT